MYKNITTTVHVDLSPRPILENDEVGQVSPASSLTSFWATQPNDHLFSTLPELTAQATFFWRLICSSLRHCLLGLLVQVDFVYAVDCTFPEEKDFPFLRFPCFMVPSPGPGCRMTKMQRILKIQWPNLLFLLKVVVCLRLHS